MIEVESLKAVFFVKDLAAIPPTARRRRSPPTRRTRPAASSSTWRTANRSSASCRTTSPDEAGFFLVPANPDSNNVRCFVVGKAIKRASLNLGAHVPRTYGPERARNNHLSVVLPKSRPCGCLGPSGGQALDIGKRYGVDEE